MTNRLQAAIDAATQAHTSGQELTEVINKVNAVLAGGGEFGKSLDRSVRRVVRQVTGVDLEPGAGHGSRRADGSISYRG